MFKKAWFFFFLTGPLCCFGQDKNNEKSFDFRVDPKVSDSIQKLFYPNFSDNPRLTKEMKEAMSPWLLPVRHKMKPVLEYLFSNPSVINDTKSLRKRGFKILFSQKLSKIRVVSHALLPGYLIKVYPNCERKLLTSGWKRLTMRCIVAEKIKSIIHQHKIKNFVVPEKWLYPLPYNKKCKKSQPVVLLVKNMNLCPQGFTNHIWKKHADRTILKELYEVLSRGYGSPFLTGNIPYTKAKKFAFVDTEYGKRKIHLKQIKKYISPALHKYWDSLVKHKGHE